MHGEEHLQQTKKKNIYSAEFSPRKFFPRFKARGSLFADAEKLTDTEHILKLCRRQGMTKSNNLHIFMCLLLHDINLF